MSEKTATPEANPKQDKDAEESKIAPEELSEEDLQLKEELLLLVDRLEDEEMGLRQNALNLLRGQIRSSTSSMTSVPKPLKFLRPQYQRIESIYEKYPDGENLKKELADVLSVLGMTIGEKRDCLKYRLQGTSEAVSSWGHEYIRHLSGEIQAEYQEKIKGGDEEMELDTEYLMELVREIIPFNMQHNAECEACDLLMEVEALDCLEQYVDELVHERVCLYLVSCVQYVAEPENTVLLTVAISIFRKFNKLASAMRLAMQLNDLKVIKDIFFSCNDNIVKKQLCFMLGRQQVFLEMPEDEMETSNELLLEIISNSQLNQHFLALARELDIVEPKLPDDVMKNHSDPARTATHDQSKMFLASTFVNGFVNCAFGKDKVTMDTDKAWFGKAKDNGMISAIASLGLILLWDIDTGLTHIDSYLYSEDVEIKAGALLATGIVNCGIRNECDPAMGILSEFVADPNLNHIKMKIAAILGLGLAYAGSCREDVMGVLSEVFTDKLNNINDKLITSEVISVAALSMGLVSLGSCDTELAVKLLSIFSKEGYNMKSTFNRFIILAVGLIYLGKQKAASPMLDAFDGLPPHIKDFGVILLDVCAYAGTGNVLKIQSLLHKASEFFTEEEDKEKDTKGKENLKDPTAVAGALHEPGAHQAVTVLGIALVAMGEDIGGEMTLRTFSHLLQYGDSVTKRSVPLALALLSASNPQLPVIDTLSKLSHDIDAETAHNAILAMGIVGAGTNNSRLVNLLKQLATYYQKDSNNLYIVRLAQGLIHLGKGTLTLNPYHSDRGLFTPVAVGSLLTILVAAMDIKNVLIGQTNPCYLLYCIALAIQPRMLVTLDTDLKPLSVSVRVGQAVDVVGQAGKPKTITGFQTHTTPVLLSYGERAELATNEYISTTPFLEGFVILQKNKDLSD